MLMLNLSFSTKLIHLHHRHLHFTQTPLISLTRTRTRWLHLSSSAAATDDIPPPPPLPPPRQEEGPVEILKSPLPVFATDDDPSPLQIATSVLLTGAITVFLFRALRRRARRAKELQFRSTGAKKTVKEEAIDRLKAMSLSSPVVETKASPPPSPLQVFLGSLAAGAIAIILYKFTITVEDGLNRQTISDNYSVRQITITVRTIINGLCYLATCVFGINSIGLFLYAGQLTIDSIMGEPTNKKTSTKNELSSTKDELSSKIESPSNATSDNSDESQSSDNL